MGNKQGTELTPEERQKLKEEKERDKFIAKQEKEKRKKEKKDEKKKKKERKKGELYVEGDEASVGGSSAWSEKSQISDKSADDRSVGSAPGSWYHSASEPSSRRSSLYHHASAGPGYYQHDCWYAGYEDGGSEKSKSRSSSRAPSCKDVNVNQLRSSSLERYPLGVPTQEPIEPLLRGGSLDLNTAAAIEYLKETQNQIDNPSLVEESNAVASRYDETIRASKEKLSISTKEKTPLPGLVLSRLASSGKQNGNIGVPPVNNASNSTNYHDNLIGLNGNPSSKNVDSSNSERPILNTFIGSDRDSLRSSVYYSAGEGDGKSSIGRSSLTGSIYYSADEGASLGGGSAFYSHTSGSDVGEFCMHEGDLFKGDRPSPPGKPEAVDRDGGALSGLAYFRVENDALLLRWDVPVTDGGSPITGYIIERSDGDSDFWIRVNLVPVKETEYAVAHLQGGREYKFRVLAENAIGLSDPSPNSELVNVTSDMESTEPHFLKELRDVVAIENEKVEFAVDIVGTPEPDVTWYKDGFEIYDTKKYEFKRMGDRYLLILLCSQLGDEGDIRVKATNRAGVSSSQAAFRIEAAPQLQVPLQYEQGLIFDTDEILRLKIPYSGKPKPTATWTKNGKLIENDERHATDVSDKFVTLKVTGANRTDKGVYGVYLSNPQGEATASFFVTVTDRPDPPNKPFVTDLTGQTVTLRWEAPTEDGGCRINNYIIEYFRLGWDVWLKASATRIPWAQLNELIVGSKYKFRIKAENAYGISDPSIESDIVTIEEESSQPGSFESDNFYKITTPEMARGESSEGASGESFDAGSIDFGVTLKRSYLDELGSSDDSDKKIKRSHLEELGESEESTDLMFYKRSYLQELGISEESAEFSEEAFKKAYFDSLGHSGDRDMDSETVMENQSTTTIVESLDSRINETSEEKHLKKIPDRPKKKSKRSDPNIHPSISEVSSELETQPGVESPEGVEAFLGDYMDRWDAYGGKNLSISLSKLNEDEAAPVPSPRMKRKGNKLSTGSEGNLSMDFLQVEGDSPAPPPRLKRSRPGSRTSQLSDISFDTSVHNSMTELPIAPPRLKKASSKSSISSGIFCTEENDEPPQPPLRMKRSGSKLSMTSQGTTETEDESMPPALPPRVPRSGYPLDEEDSITLSANTVEAAPHSTPSTQTTKITSRVKARMEEVTVAIGDDAVLVVALDGEKVSNVVWQLSGESLVSSSKYSTSSTYQSAQLVIHKSTSNDSGTYTAVVTRTDGSQAKATVALLVATKGAPIRPEAPIFVRALSDLGAKVGTRVRFLVELRASHNVSVFWYHQNNEVLESPRTKLLHEGNFFCLDISPLSVEDEGPWRCVAENAAGQATNTANLRVVVPKGYRPPVFLEELEALLTAEGTVSLECKVVGVPTPILKWYKDGKEIKAGDVFALTANPDDPNSLGTYKCEAINCMGRGISSSRVKVISRDISGPPSRGRSPTPVGPVPTFKEELENSRIKIGEKLKLNVQVNTPPDIQSITWYNNAQRIELSEKYRLCDEGGGRYALEAGPLEIGDDGDWKCVVKSAGGYATSNCKVTLAIPRNYRTPRFLENLRALLTDEGLVSFECKVVGFPTPVLQWFKDGQELKPGDVYQLSGTNSLGKYSCIARNCMGEASSSAELTLEDIKSHLNEDERCQLLATNVPPRFIQGLRSSDVKIGDSIRLSVHVTTMKTPKVTWYSDDQIVSDSNNIRLTEADNGIFHLDILSAELNDQGEWKCEASNEHGHSVSSASVKLIIPRHYKKPVFLEPLRAILSPEGMVNLECKVIGVPQPILKWFKDGTELKPGDIHRIISGESGTCCLGTYTCEAKNCMGTVSSSAVLHGFEGNEKLSKDINNALPEETRTLARHPSLSTINEEHSSQISVYESATDESSTEEEEKAEVSVSIDGKEISLSMYETPDISEADVKQIAEIYAEEISDHVSGMDNNQAELPPLRFTKETSRKGPIIVDAMVIDVENEAFDEYMSMSDLLMDDLRTEADLEELSVLDHVVVDEREVFQSDLIDIPDIEAWEEEQIQSKTTLSSGKNVAAINQPIILETDLRSLSEQGLSLLQTEEEFSEEFPLTEIEKISASNKNDPKKTKVKKRKAKLNQDVEQQVAESHEQVILSGVEGLTTTQATSSKAGVSMAETEAIQVEEQVNLSQVESFTGDSLKSDKNASVIMGLKEAIGVHELQQLEESQNLSASERSAKKLRPSNSYEEAMKNVIMIEEAAVLESETPTNQNKQCVKEHAKVSLLEQVASQVEGTNVLEEPYTLSDSTVAEDQANVLQSLKEGIAVQEYHPRNEDSLPNSFEISSYDMENADEKHQSLFGTAEENQEPVLPVMQHIPNTFSADETESDISDMHSLTEVNYIVEHPSEEIWRDDIQTSVDSINNICAEDEEGFYNVDFIDNEQQIAIKAYQSFEETPYIYDPMILDENVENIPEDASYVDLDSENYMLDAVQSVPGTVVECITIQNPDLQVESLNDSKMATKSKKATSKVAKGATKSAEIKTAPDIMFKDDASHSTDNKEILTIKKEESQAIIQSSVTVPSKPKKVKYEKLQAEIEKIEKQEASELSPHLKEKKIELITAMETIVKSAQIELIDSIRSSKANVIQSLETVNDEVRKTLQEVCTVQIKDVVQEYGDLLKIDKSSVVQLQKAVLGVMQEELIDCQTEIAEIIKPKKPFPFADQEGESEEIQNDQSKKNNNLAMTDKGPESLTKEQLTAKREEILAKKKELLDKQLLAKRREIAEESSTSDLTSDFDSSELTSLENESETGTIDLTSEHSTNEDISEADSVIENILCTDEELNKEDSMHPLTDKISKTGKKKARQLKKEPKDKEVTKDKGNGGEDKNLNENEAFVQIASNTDSVTDSETVLSDEVSLQYETIINDSVDNKHQQKNDTKPLSKMIAVKDIPVSIQSHVAEALTILQAEENLKDSFVCGDTQVILENINVHELKDISPEISLSKFTPQVATDKGVQLEEKAKVSQGDSINQAVADEHSLISDPKEALQEKVKITVANLSPQLAAETMEAFTQLQLDEMTDISFLSSELKNKLPIDVVNQLVEAIQVKSTILKSSSEKQKASDCEKSKLDTEPMKTNDLTDNTNLITQESFMAVSQNLINTPEKDLTPVEVFQQNLEVITEELSSKLAPQVVDAVMQLKLEEKVEISCLSKHLLIELPAHVASKLDKALKASVNLSRINNQTDGKTNDASQKIKIEEKLIAEHITTNQSDLIAKYDSSSLMETDNDDMHSSISSQQMIESLTPTKIEGEIEKTHVHDPSKTKTMEEKQNIVSLAQNVQNDSKSDSDFSSVIEADNNDINSSISSQQMIESFTPIKIEGELEKTHVHDSSKIKTMEEKQDIVTPAQNEESDSITDPDFSSVIETDNNDMHSSISSQQMIESLTPTKIEGKSEKTHVHDPSKIKTMEEKQDIVTPVQIAQIIELNRKNEKELVDLVSEPIGKNLAEKETNIVNDLFSKAEKPVRLPNMDVPMESLATQIHSLSVDSPLLEQILETGNQLEIESVQKFIAEHGTSQSAEALLQSLKQSADIQIDSTANRSDIATKNVMTQLQLNEGKDMLRQLCLEEKLSSDNFVEQMTGKTETTSCQQGISKELVTAFPVDNNLIISENTASHVSKEVTDLSNKTNFDGKSCTILENIKVVTKELPQNIAAQVEESIVALSKEGTCVISSLPASVKNNLSEEVVLQIQKVLDIEANSLTADVIDSSVTQKHIKNTTSKDSSLKVTTELEDKLISSAGLDSLQKRHIKEGDLNLKQSLNVNQTSTETNIPSFDTVIQSQIDIATKDLPVQQVKKIKDAINQLQLEGKADISTFPDIVKESFPKVVLSELSTALKLNEKTLQESLSSQKSDVIENDKEEIKKSKQKAAQSIQNLKNLPSEVATELMQVLKASQSDISEESSQALVSLLQDSQTLATSETTVSGEDLVCSIKNLPEEVAHSLMKSLNEEIVKVETNKKPKTKKSVETKLEIIEGHKNSLQNMKDNNEVTGIHEPLGSDGALENNKFEESLNINKPKNSMNEAEKSIKIKTDDSQIKTEQCTTDEANMNMLDNKKRKSIINTQAKENKPILAKEETENESKVSHKQKDIEITDNEENEEMKNNIKQAIEQTSVKAMDDERKELESKRKVQTEDAKLNKEKINKEEPNNETKDQDEQIQKEVNVEVRTKEKEKTKEKDKNKEGLELSKQNKKLANDDAKEIEKDSLGDEFETIREYRLEQNTKEDAVTEEKEVVDKMEENQQDNTSKDNMNKITKRDNKETVEDKELKLKRKEQKAKKAKEDAEIEENERKEKEALELKRKEQLEQKIKDSKDEAEKEKLRQEKLAKQRKEERESKLKALEEKEKELEIKENELKQKRLREKREKEENEAKEEAERFQTENAIQKEKEKKKAAEERERLEKEQLEREEYLKERKNKQEKQLEHQKELEAIEEEERQIAAERKAEKEKQIKDLEEETKRLELAAKEKREKNEKERKKREREEREAEELRILQKENEEKERRNKEREQHFLDAEKQMQQEMERIEKRRREREAQFKEEEDKIKREEEIRREEKRKQQEEKEQLAREEEKKLANMNEEKARRKRENTEKIQNEKKVLEEKEKDLENKRRQKQEENERLRQEEEMRFKKEEEERLQRKLKRQKEEEEIAKERQASLEEQQQKEENRRKAEREKRRKEREEQELREEQEEEKKRQQRRKRFEDEKKKIDDENKKRDEERRTIQEKRKQEEEELKRQEEQKLKQQAEIFLKKEEERKLKRLEEQKKQEEDEERRRKNRTAEDIQYSETELIDNGKLAKLMERRARNQSPEQDMARRDPRRRPKFSTKLQDRQTLKGTRVRLTCNILTSPEDQAPEVEWFKGGYPMKEDDRVKISYIDGVASLEMVNVARIDSGEYTCSAKNRHGRVSTSCDLRVKGEDDQRPTAPTFTTSLRERYNSDDDELVISCHVTGHPTPKIVWLKDADQLPTSSRFHTSISEEGICKLIIQSPRAADSGTFACHAENRVYRDEITSSIHVSAILANKNQQATQPDNTESPRFITQLCDQNVEENGTLSLQVEVAGNPSPDVMWLYNGRSLPPSGKFRVSASASTHTLTVFQVSKSDLGTYSCKIRNKYGLAYTLSTIGFDTLRSKRLTSDYTEDSALCVPTFLERPESLVTVGRNEEIRLSCLVQGNPTPRVSWYRGHHDISVTGRAHKTVRDNRHTILMRDAQFTDSGTYTVEAKNSQGTCRAYCSIKVRELQRGGRGDSPQLSESRVPSKDVTEIEIKRRSGRYIRDVPGKVGNPRATDIGKNWVSLHWDKPEHSGGAPVTAFKVESWILGEEARWQELGVSPIASFDAYYMKTDREYLFRITPRNKYGWGEAVMTPQPVRVGRSVEAPSMPRGLPSQIRCMPGGTVYLEGQVTGDPTPEIRWYKDGSHFDCSKYPRFTSHISDGNLHNVFGYVHKVSIKIEDLQPEDEGRYEVEVVNQGGRVTSATKILPTYDCSVLQAQESINRSLMALSRLDEVTHMAPQFTMRLRDRRVQVGFPVRLTCQIVGAPKPTVQWFMDGEEVSPDDTHTMWEEDGHFYTLELASSSHEDAAVYSVQAVNEFGSIMCKSRLVVDSGLKSYVSPMFLKELEDASVKEGQVILLQAIIEAYPTIGVVWHRDGQRIRPSRKHTFSLGADGMAVLMVKNAEYQDGGLYTCTAANEMGKVESYCRVSVSSTNQTLSKKKDSSKSILSPMFVRKPRTIDAEEGDLVIIECEVAGDPKPSVRWLRDWLEPKVYLDGARFKEVGTGPVYRLEIPNSKLEDTGAYSILAHNEHGEAKAVISLQVYAKGLKKIEGGSIKRGLMEHIPNIVRPLQDVRCCDGDSVTLEALIDAPETSIIRWEKQGKVLKEGGDVISEWDGSLVRLKINEVYPEDEGEYSCIVFNDLGKAVTSATIVVEMADDKENDVTVQMDYRPDLSRRTTPSRTNTPSRYSRSPSVNFQREGSAHSWAGVGWREPSVPISHWRPLSRGSSPLLLGHHRRTPEPTSTRSKQRRVQRPKFYYIPHDRIVEEGETVTFQCAVKGVPMPKAVWDKDSRTIVPGGRIKMEERNEIRLLEIPKVTQQDAGLYRVTIDNNLGREQATARLDVLKATSNKYLGYVRSWNSAPLSSPRFSRTVPTQTLIEGNRLSMETEFRGSPKPRVKWYRNCELLPICDEFKQTSDGQKATLQIDKITSADAGIYSCILINKAGRSEFTTKVYVESGVDAMTNSPPVFIRPLVDTTANDGDEIKLSVKVDGAQPMKVLWVKNDTKIESSKDFRYEETSHKEYSLVISDAFPKDSGIYFCEAFNAHGHAETHAKVEIADPHATLPYSPKICGCLTPMSVQEGQSSRFSIRIIGFPDPQVSWYLDNLPLHDSERVKLGIDEPDDDDIGLVYSCGFVSPICADSGVLSVIASNSEGKSTLETTFNVTPCLPKELVSRRIPTRDSDITTHPTSEKYSPNKSPVTTNRNKTLKEMTAIVSQDSAYCSSGRSSSLSISNESDMPHIPTRVDSPKSVLQKQEENSESSDTTSLNSVVNRLNGNVSEEESFGEEETGAVIICGPQDTIVLERQNAVLSASFSGHPEPEVIWYKKEKEIEDGGRYTIIKSRETTSLTIRDVTFDDCDKYTLKVRNSTSAHSAFASLAVEGVPQPPAGKPNLSDVTNSSVIVSWYGPTYDGGRVIIGYRLEGRKIGHVLWDALANRCHSTSFKAEGLEKGAQYEFRVRAENVHGLSEPSKISNLVSLENTYESMSELSDEDFENENSPFYKPGSVGLESGDFFQERFDQHEEVGKGRFGVVYRVSEKDTGKRRAAKLIKCIRKEEREKVKDEILIMNSLKHPKLLQLLAAYERKKDCVMIMEYISGGELFERVVADDFTLTEKDCILFVRQICEGVDYMHGNSIVHLDLKPENILCVRRSSHQIKLIDFGLARKLDINKPCRVLFGTPEFVAPEIINYEPISFASDMWSVGVICYVLLSGLSPFMGESDAETFANITRAEYDFDDESFDAISNDAKDFIMRMLDKRKDKRPIASECLQCGWLAQSEKAMNKVVLPTDKLKRFIIRRKWQESTSTKLERQVA